MQMNPYLMFDGNCRDAFTFYEQSLGGTLEAMFSFGETPASEHVPADHRDKIMHARLVLGDQALMGSDSIPDHPYEGVKGCSISLNVESTTEAERVFNALAAEGVVTMPLGQTFWAERFGMLVDKFGVPWMVNYEGQPGA